MRRGMRKGILLLSVSLFALFFCLTASAQNRNIGRLNTWRTGLFWRKHESRKLSYVRVVRAAQQDGFDRVVFEFEGPIPNYGIGYLASRFYGYEGETEPIKIAGDAFIVVNFNLIPSDEKQLALSQRKQFLPKGQLRMPALLEMESKGLFEGDYAFLLGLKSRTPFRVRELSNPSRLVIDLKQ